MKFIYTILLLALAFQINAQSKPKPVKISIPNNSKILSFEEKASPIEYDSTGLINKASAKVCALLKNGAESKTMNPANFISEGFRSFIADISVDSMAQLGKFLSPKSESHSAESYTTVWQFLLKKNMNECPSFNDVIQFDGKQRPAYAHLSNQICKCVDRKMAMFKDRELAILKFQYINDSCGVEVFSDEKSRDIVFKANNFETKAQVDSFDLNFKPYLFKNCAAHFEATMTLFNNQIKSMFDAMQKSATPLKNELNDNRNLKIYPLMYHITGVIGSPNSEKIESNFLSNSYYKASLPQLNTAKVFFKNTMNLDYLQDFITRSDGITEIKLTVYQYMAKAKKRVVKGLVIFEFENDNDKVSTFRFIPQTQIPNYEDLQRRINSH